MAVEIKTESKDGGKTNLSNKFNNEVFATQGNVVNTIIAFNEQIKKQYTDNASSKTENDTVQESLRVLASTLDKNTGVTGTFASGTSVKDSDLTNDTTGNKSFDASGLINKINILANIISGSTSSSDQTWSSSTVGNTVGKKADSSLQTQSTDNVPVIGYVKGETSYTFTGDYDNERHTSPKVNGLTTVSDTDVSSKVVLSERQTADMVEASSKDIINYYNGQIDVIKDFMRGLNSSDSFSYALLHCTADYVSYSPMQVIGYETTSSEFVYKIQTLNNKTLSLPIDGNTYHMTIDSNGNASFVKGESTTPVNIGTVDEPSYLGFNLTYDESKSAIKVNVYDNGAWNGSYNLPVTRYNLGISISGVNNTASTSYSIIAGIDGYKILKDETLGWTTDSSKITASVSVPMGMGVSVKLNDHGDLHFEQDGSVLSTDSYTVSSGEIYIKSISSDTNVYSNCYNVTINYANGSALVSQTVLEGKTISGLGSVTRTGYTFARYIDSLGNTVTDATRVYADMSITAEWTAIIYEISYIGDFDKAVNSNPKTYTIEDTINLVSVAKQCYAFNGWYSDSDCTEKVETIPAGTTGNKTFYISYVPETYKITYVLDGGNFEGIDYATTYTYGTGTALPTPVRNLRTFVSWYTDVNLTSPITSISSSYYGDIILYAKWSSTSSYSITYELNGGTNNPSNLEIYTVENCPVSLLTPTKTGYTFVGWYTNSSLNASSAISSINESDARNYTLYAKFVANADTEYKVNYYVLIDGQNYNLTKTDYGKTYSDAVLTLDTTKFENNYEGYVLSDTNTYSKVINADGSTEFDIYFLPEEYSITYKYATHVNNTNEFLNEPRKYSYGAKSVYLPEIEPTDGYIFDGWFEQLDNKSYYNKKSRIDSYSMGNKVFFAKWTRKAPDESLFTVNNQSSLSDTGSIVVDYDNLPSDSILCYYNDESNGWVPVTSAASTIKYTGQTRFRYAETSGAEGYISVSDEIVLTVKKYVASPSESLFTVTKASSDIASDGKISISSVAYGLEYATSNNGVYSIIHEGTNLSGLPADVAYYFRYAETDDSISSATTTVTLGTKTIPEAPEVTFAVTNASTYYSNDAKVKVTYNSTNSDNLVLEYTTDNGASYSLVDKISKTISGLHMGTTVSVRWRETSTTLPSETLSVVTGVKYYKVTFDYADVDLSTNTKVSSNLVVSVRGGDRISEPDSPSRTGYSFTKWTLNDTTYNFASEVTEDITLTANWTANKYPITYLPGKYSSSLVDVEADFDLLPSQYTYDGSLSLKDYIIENGISENISVEFEYWTLNDEKIDTISFPATHTVDGIIVTAHWKDITPPNSVDDVIVSIDTNSSDSNKVTLSWTNPEDCDFKSVKLYIDSKEATTGDVIYDSSDSNYTLISDDSSNGTGKVVLNLTKESHTIAICTVDDSENIQGINDAYNVTIPAYSISINGDLGIFSDTGLMLVDSDNQSVSNVSWSISSDAFATISGNTLVNKNISSEAQGLDITASIDNLSYMSTVSLSKLTITVSKDEDDTLSGASNGSAGATVSIESEDEVEKLNAEISIEWSISGDSEYVTSDSLIDKHISLTGTGLYMSSTGENYVFTATPTVKVGEYSTTLSPVSFSIKSAVLMVSSNMVTTKFDSASKTLKVTDIVKSASDSSSAGIAEKRTYYWYRYNGDYTKDVPVLMDTTEKTEYTLTDTDMADNVNAYYVVVLGNVSNISLTEGIAASIKNTVANIGMVAVKASAPDYTEDKTSVSFVDCSIDDEYVYITPEYKNGGITTVTLTDANNETTTVDVKFNAYHMYKDISINAFDDIPDAQIFDITVASSISSSDGSIKLNSSVKSYRTVEYSKDGNTWTSMKSGDTVSGLKYTDKVYFKYTASAGAYNESSTSLELTSGVKQITVTLDVNNGVSDEKTYIINNGADIRKVITSDELGKLTKTGHTLIGLSKAENQSWDNVDTSNSYIYNGLTMNYSEVAGFSDITYSESSSFTLTVDSGDIITLTAIWAPNVYTGTFSLNGAQTATTGSKSKTAKYIYGSYVSIPTFDSSTEGVLYVPTGAVSSYTDGTSQEVTLKGWTLNPTDVTGITSYDDTSFETKGDGVTGYIGPDVTLIEDFTVYAVLVDEETTGVSNVNVKIDNVGNIKLYFTVPSYTDTYSIGMYRVSGTSDTQRVRVSSTIWGVRNCYVGDDKIIGGVIYYYPDSTSLAGLTFNLIANATDSYSIYSLDVANNPSYLGTQQVVDITAYKGETLIIGASDSNKNTSCIPFTVPSSESVSTYKDSSYANPLDKISIGSLYVKDVLGTTKETSEALIVENTTSGDTKVYATPHILESSAYITGTGAKSVASTASITVSSVRTDNYNDLYYESYKVITQSSSIEVVNPFSLTVNSPTELNSYKGLSTTISVTKASDISDSSVLGLSWESSNEKALVILSSDNDGATVSVYDGMDAEVGTVNVSATSKSGHTITSDNITVDFAAMSKTYKASDFGFSTVTNVVYLDTTKDHYAVNAVIDNSNSSVTIATIASSSNDTSGYAEETELMVYGTIGEYNVYKKITVTSYVTGIFEMEQDSITTIQYNVIFDGNGGVVEGSNSISIYTTYQGNDGASLTQEQLDSIKATYYGYKFLNWSTSKTANDEYKAGATISGNITLYAVWEEGFTLTADTNPLYLNCNDVYGGSHKTGMITVSKYEDAKFYASPVYTSGDDTVATASTYANDNYVCLVTANSVGKTSVNAKVDNITKSYDVEVVDFSFTDDVTELELGKTAVVKIGLNGMTNNDVSMSIVGDYVDSENCTYDSSSGTYTIKTKAEGSLFNDGKESETVTVTATLKDTGITISKTITLNEAVETVSIYRNNGSDVESVNVQYGHSLAEPSVTYEGYILSGWYKNADFSGDKFDFSSGITEDISIYAKWEESFSLSPDAISIATYDTDTSISVTLTDSSKYGYDDIKISDEKEIFTYELGSDGKLTVTAGLINSYDENYKITFSIGNLVKTVGVIAKPKYTVEFNSLGGSAVPSQTVIYGELATKPDTPTKAGWTLENWYSSTTITEANVYSFNVPVTKDIYLYANWEDKVNAGAVSSLTAEVTEPVDGKVDVTLSWVNPTPEDNDLTYLGVVCDTSNTHLTKDDSTPIITSYTITGLSATADHTFEVSTYDKVGNKSDAVSLTVKAISITGASNVSIGQIQLALDTTDTVTWYIDSDTYASISTSGVVTGSDNPGKSVKVYATVGSVTYEKSINIVEAYNVGDIITLTGDTVSENVIVTKADDVKDETVSWSTSSTNIISIDSTSNYVVESDGTSQSMATVSAANTENATTGNAILTAVMTSGDNVSIRNYIVPVKYQASTLTINPADIGFSTVTEFRANDSVSESINITSTSDGVITAGTISPAYSVVSITVYGQNDSGEDVQATLTFTEIVTGKLTYAVGGAVKICVVTLNTNSDTARISSGESRIYVGQGGKVESITAVVENDGYIFGGWYTEEEFTNEFDTDTEIIKSITLYAKWNNGFSISPTEYVLNNGESFDVTLTFNDGYAGSNGIKWESSDETLATIGSGTETVTVTATSQKLYGDVSITATVGNLTLSTAVKVVYITLTGITSMDSTGETNLILNISDNYKDEDVEWQIQ